MSLDFSSLNDNISSILATAHPIVPSDHVTDFYGKILYSSSSMIGRGWRCLYATCDYLWHEYIPRPLEVIKLERNFKNSEKLFREVLREIQALNEKISMCFSEKKNRDRQVAEPLRTASLTIIDSLTSFFDQNTPFSLPKKLERIQAAFQRVLGHTPFSSADMKILRSFEKRAAICAVEGSLQMPFPLEAFSALLNGEAFDVQEWILRVKENENKLSPWLLHQALLGVVEALLQGKVEDSLLPRMTYSLELKLLKKGCRLLTKEDELYTKWLQTMVPGTLLAGQVEVRLGNTRSCSAFTKQGLIVFDRSGFPNQMVVFAKTPALLGMWRASCLENNAMVPCVKVLFEDPEGKYLVAEKVSTPLDQMNWKTKFAKVADDDLPRTEEIARVLAWMSSQDVTPRVDPSHIFFTTSEHPSGERLCTLVPFKTKNPHDYNVLFRLAMTASANNDLIFRHIMMRSQLIDHPVAKFYLKIAEQHLTNSARHPIADQASLDGIKDPVVYERAKDMVIALKTKGQEIFLLLTQELVSRDEVAQEDLRKEIAKALITFQKEQGCPACDWPTRDKAPDKLLKDMVKAERPDLFRPARALPGEALALARSPFTVFRE